LALLGLYLESDSSQNYGKDIQVPMDEKKLEGKKELVR